MIDKDLNIYDEVCTGCSACTEACFYPDENGVLPINLIKNQEGLFVPRIDMNSCVKCNACYRACPTEDKIYNNDNLSFENYKNNIGTSYYGYSLDNEHRFEAATAGITTEIAMYLLKSNQVDGVVSSYQDDNTNEIVTKIFTNPEEIKKTKGSIYRQVTLLNGLDAKVKEGNHKKLLVIGLPCHIAGLKTLKKANKYLRKNVEFITIALFCKQTKKEEFSDFQRTLLKAKTNEKIFYRGKGWSGLTRVKGRLTLPFTNIKFSLNWSTFSFTPDYCFTCSDPLGLEADISVGDAWLKKYYHDKIGSSLFVANSQIGNKIIDEMKNKNIIFAQIETKENIVLSQSPDYIRFKTSNPIQRDISFGTKRENDKVITPKQYIRLINWIKLNKSFYEFLINKNIVKYLPEILLKIYSKISGKIFGVFSR
jgi:coenzyme F420 hydrogenase subunit beta